ncbi:glycoside hydrolase family 68 protein [Fructobacillus durionis]|nr:glycoside hydrolase family 68 protein [Fructobacillus durionis]
MKSGIHIGLVAIALITLGSVATYKYQHKSEGETTHYTRADLLSLSSQVKEKKYQAPQVTNTALMKDVPSGKVWDAATNKEEDVLVWDSWPVTDKDGNVADYHGYHIVIGLTAKGARQDSSGVKLGMYIQKASVKDDDISSWQYIGDVFNTFGEGRDKSKKDKYLDQIVSEWSGSTVQLNKNDNTLRVFYTNKVGKEGQAQALTTAKIQVDPKDGQNWSSGLSINHAKASDHKTVFVGDGKYYQTVDQIEKKNGVTDSFAMRDPHIVVDGDKYYLTFEGNTGTKANYQGNNNFNNQAYYGSDSLFKSEVERLKANKQSEEYARAYLSNSALGKLELNKDFTVKKVMKPMVTSNATHDMFERPNLVKYKGRWYLFTSVWGIYLASSDPALKSQTFMLGWVSDGGINGTYRPLNGNALVLASDIPLDKKNMMYSYLAIPSNKKNKSEFIVTAFQGSRTFAPSMKIEVHGDKTSVNNNILLNQGAVVDSGKYYKTTAQNIK